MVRFATMATMAATRDERAAEGCLKKRECTYNAVSRSVQDGSGRLTYQDATFLFLAGAIGGALNAVAGGGSFITFPALLFTGVPAIPANATNSMAMSIGVAASGGAYRSRLDISRRVLVPLLIACIVGTLAGALLLVHTPAHTFMLILPWLMLGATLLFTFGRRVAGRITGGAGHEATNAAVVGACIFELFVGIYGGYFGGGMGIMMLAMLAVLGMTDIHAMNAVRIVLGGTINGVSALIFIVAGVIYWPQAIVMTFGAILGGYASAHYALKLPQSWIRALVVVVGFSMTTYFFIRAYL
jgi:uncharacterized membrane protein YfcA